MTGPGLKAFAARANNANDEATLCTFIMHSNSQKVAEEARCMKRQ